VHECVVPELRRCDVEVVNRNVDNRLRAALQAGRPMGTVGALNLVTVSVSGLQDAIAYVGVVGCNGCGGGGYGGAGVTCVGWGWGWGS
jgi:hypothetical protein